MMTQSPMSVPMAATRGPVLALLGANIVSLVGSMLTIVALPWFVLITTGSAAKTGLTGAFEVLPMFVAGVFGGTLVDRLGYKRSSVIADVVSGVGVALVPLLYHTVGLAFWQLLLFVFIGSLLSVPGLTARRAMLPELAQMAGWRLERVNASFESVQFIALLLGPPIAGLLIAIIGASNVLWLDATSFGVSALVVASVIPRVASGVEGAARGAYRDELRAGLRFILNDRLLLTLALGLAVTNMLGNPLFGVVLPVFARDVYGKASVLGIIIAAGGAGQIVGATLYGAFGHRLPRRALWLAAFLIEPLVWLPLVVTHSLPVIIGALAAGGILIGPTNPMLVTIRHERIPQELRGRVFSTFSAISGVAQPFGLALGGVAVQVFGLRGTLIALTLALCAVGVAMLFLPVLREMDRKGGT
jgi:MFS family permease